MTIPLTSPAAVFFMLFLLVLVAPLLAQRLRIPGIMGLIIGGIVVGPGGANLLLHEGLIAQLGGAGLLYLMFIAGLELNIEQVARVRRSTATLSIATFALPMMLGTAAGVSTGHTLLASVLLGSLWASHTPLVYPMARSYGLQRERSVVTALFATVVTTTLALFVLVVVAEIQVTGYLSLPVGLVLAIRIAALAFGTLFVAPRIIGRLLRGIGHDRPVRMLIILSAAFGGSVLAEALSIDAIIGAFLMGLGLNRLVPRGGVLLERLELLGTGLFIPVFLISVGMMVHLELILEPRTMIVGGVFALAALGGKAAAAALAGRAHGMSRAEIGVMFSLSGAQAAATLAATIVGLRIGLFDDEVVHAVIFVVVVTVAVAGWAAARYMPRIAVAPLAADLGERVVVPVSHPQYAVEHMEFASRLAFSDRGLVVPLHVVTDPGQPDTSLAAKRAWVADLEAAGYREGIEAQGQLRLDASVAQGVARVVRETDASAVVIGWTAEPSFSPIVAVGIAHEIVARSSVPVLMVRQSSMAPSRVVVSVTQADLLPRRAHAATLAAAVAAKLAQSARVDVLLVAGDATGIDPLLASIGRSDIDIDAGPRTDALRDLVEPGDIVVVPGNEIGSGWFARDAVMLAEQFPDVTLVVVVGPHRASVSDPSSFGVVRLDPTVHQIDDGAGARGVDETRDGHR